ncbi:hypothetical protein [Sphingomonas sp. URHD0057]|uniref:hypothetical protein n=1 Tax=Sphingomonas sp. URHD0057 TaxID=1380389 RepID=UPI00048E7984|nr:hypothetical protein [Sphingomonas sp. URHD0057]
MRKAAIAIGALCLAGTATAQSGGPGDTGGRGTVSPPSDTASDPPGSGGGWARKYDSQGRMGEADYQQELARRIAAAQALVGRPLTERDRGKIRAAISADLIAWRKQYDPRRADYRAMHDRWLVDEQALSPEGWAKQRVDWLRAQQEWIGSGG